MRKKQEKDSALIVGPDNYEIADKIIARLQYAHSLLFRLLARGLSLYVYIFLCCIFGLASMQLGLVSLIVVLEVSRGRLSKVVTCRQRSRVTLTALNTHSAGYYTSELIVECAQGCGDAQPSLSNPLGRRLPGSRLDLGSYCRRVSPSHGPCSCSLRSPVR